MIEKIRDKIDKELTVFIKDTDKTYSLSKVSPLLSKTIKEFILRKGKRVRPILFVIGYLGYSKKRAKNLYKCAISLELLHDFLLIHDDIIDKSDIRRNRPSLHKVFNNYLKKYEDVKFSGQDLAIVAADIIYAMAIGAFLSIDEGKFEKGKALKIFTDAAIYTEMGEFIELINQLKPIDKIKQKDVYQIYDYKTSYYTFSYPLSIGAALAKADKKEIKKLTQYGLLLGRAFQIKDDILGMFSEEKKTGKSALSDLGEGKRTILIWYAYKHSNNKDKSIIKRILSKKHTKRVELLRIRKIITKSGSLDYAKNEIENIIKKTKKLNRQLKIKKRYKNILENYLLKLLKI